ncbi:MAG: hypothetical protein ACI83W_000384 [Marinoscillum sp.]|jgi:hypothetical protein
MDNWFKRNLSSPIINHFGRAKVERHFTEPPILVGGCGRSGTTLLLSILSAHPSIYAIPYEADAFTNWKNDNGSLIPTRLDRFHRSILKGEVSKNQNRWCEKRPANVNHIQPILDYFGPKAKFIHLVRDPRAVCTSYHPSDANNYWIPIDRYVQDVSNGLLYKDHPQVYTLKYEDLVLGTDQTMAQLCQFLEIDHSAELKDWSNHATVRQHNAWNESVKPISVDSLSKWKDLRHSTIINDLRRNKSILKIMDTLGYSL